MNKLLKFKMLKLGIFLLCILLTQTAFAQNTEKLSDKVEAAITTRYNPMKIDVSAKAPGWIKITGNVNSLFDKYRIYEIASHINGVKKITNDIMVVPRKTPGNVNPNMKPAAMIKQQIRTLINRTAAIDEPQKINVSVDNSAVKLTGTVSFYREKVFAQTIASQIKGVKSIKNDIKVVPIDKAITDNNIKDVLFSLLRDEFPRVDKNNINIKVENGFVTVSGEVSNLWEKDNIGDEFSSVVGVIDVINRLEVNPRLSS